MGLTRKVPAEMAKLNEQEQGEPDTENRFASARFVVKVQPEAEQSEASPDDDSDREVPEQDD